MKFGCNQPSSFRGEVVWNCGPTDDGRTTDNRACLYYKLPQLQIVNMGSQKSSGNYMPSVKTDLLKVQSACATSKDWDLIHASGLVLRSQWDLLICVSTSDWDFKGTLRLGPGVETMLSKILLNLCSDNWCLQYFMGHVQKVTTDISKMMRACASCKVWSLKHALWLVPTANTEISKLSLYLGQKWWLRPQNCLRSQMYFRTEIQKVSKDLCLLWKLLSQTCLWASINSKGQDLKVP